MEKIELLKDVYFDKSYSNVIDREFKEFDATTNTTAQKRPTVDEFFTIYNELFYDIPKEGDSNSHRVLLDKSANYLGVNVSNNSIQALIDEVTSLRQQILDAATASSNKI
jgi:hypothetical protein